MKDQRADRRRGRKRWLEEHDQIWVIAFTLALFGAYGIAIYSFAHGNDFLMKSNTPFESAVW
jgi:hypothetical protein